MARAAREVGADYVLDMEVPKRLDDGPWRLKVRIIRSDQDVIIVQEQFPYDDERTKAIELAQRVVEVAKAALERQGALSEPESASRSPSRQDLAGEPDLDRSEPASGVAGAPAQPGGPPDTSGRPPALPSGVADSAAVAPLAVPPPDTLQFYTPDMVPPTQPRATIDLSTLPTSRPKPRLLHITVAFGSGLFRDYSVSADAVPNSSIGYQVSPAPFFRGMLQLIVPSVGLGLSADVGFRTLNYTVESLDGPDEELPGQLFDFDVNLVYRWRTPRLDIIPKVGARIGVTAVDRQEGFGDIPAATSIAAVGGCDLLVRGQGWDIRAGGDFGWTLSYDERPRTTGQNGAGPAFAARAGATVWLNDQIGIGIDAIFSGEFLNFEGQPTRFVPEDEVAGLTDAQVTILDFRATGGARLRI